MRTAHAWLISLATLLCVPREQAAMDARTLCSGHPWASAWEGGAWRSRRRAQGHIPHRRIVARALFDPPPFRPDKLTVTYTDSSPTLCGQGQGTPSQGSRRYTLTHNDITGALQLTVGSDYNVQQISGFYTRLLRDEVVAEWHFSPRPCLHIYCHVSGEERWLAPPRLRNYIFRRELPLVLDTILYADRQLLQEHPELSEAEVYVHFQSAQQDLDGVELWGILGQRTSWQSVPTSILKRVLMMLIGQEAQLQQQEHLKWQQQQQQPPHVSSSTPPQTTLQPQPSTKHTAVQLPGSTYLSVAPVVAAMDVLEQPYTTCASNGTSSSNGSSDVCSSSKQGDVLAGPTLFEPLTQPPITVRDTAGAPAQPAADQQQQPSVAVAADASTGQGVNSGGVPVEGDQVVVCTSLLTEPLPFNLGPLPQEVAVQQQRPGSLHAERQRLQGVLTRSGARM